MKLDNRNQSICVCAIFLLAITIFASCAKTWQVSKDDFARRTEILDLFEKVFRHVMPKKPSRHTWTYYLEIEGKNPPSDFLDRFAGYFHQVKKGSEFVDGRTTRLSIYYKWCGENSVEVIVASYRMGHIGPSTTPYIWERKKGKWILKSVGIELTG